MENSIKSELFIEGMHCAACELLVEKRLSKVDGVKSVEAKLSKGTVCIQSDNDLDIQKLNELIKDDGYTIVKNKNTNVKRNWKDLFIGLIIAIVFFLIFLLLQKSGIANLGASNKQQITLSFIFIIGVIASLSTCMAVVGGLVLSLSSKYAKDQKLKPVILFHISRLIGFFILGGVIGLIGTAFILTPLVSFILNLVLFLVMILMAINLLEILPVTKKFQFKMPKFIGRRVLIFGDSNTDLTPILLGAVTFFLPCGFTQSMQLLALTSGSIVTGAIIMLVFALGTLPILAFISFASTKLSKGFKSGIFFKTAGFIIILFALFNFTASLTALGLINPIFNI